jgi:hypothetical protein
MKKPGMSLALFFLSLMLLFITTATSRSQPIVKVHGDIDQMATRLLVENCLQQLNVHEDFILMIRISEDIYRTCPGFTTCQPPSESNFKPIIRVWIKANIKEKRFREILAHEMIHVKQFAKGQLKINKQHEVFWNDKKYYSKAGRHKLIPWEFEAHRDDGKLAKLLSEMASEPLIAKRSRP